MQNIKVILLCYDYEVVIRTLRTFARNPISLLFEKILHTFIVNGDTLKNFKSPIKYPVCVVDSPNHLSEKSPVEFPWPVYLSTHQTFRTRP